MFEEYETFVRTLEEGGLSAAARRLGVSPAVVSKRLARLEDRLGVRLIARTTRRIAPTEAGRLFHDRIAAVLEAAADAEALVSQRSAAARGVLKVSAPTSFGRRHLAPHLKAFTDAHPDLTLELDLSDAFVDLKAEGVDVAVRIAALDEAEPSVRRLAANRRVLCATPGYLAEHGAPETLGDLRRHRLLAASNQTVWRLDGPEGRTHFRARSAIRTNSSEVARETLLAGMGIALRSTWDVGEELHDGRLAVVLPDHAGAADVAVLAVTTERGRQTARVRAFVDFLAGLYGPEPYWDRGPPDPLMPAEAGTQ